MTETAERARAARSTEAVLSALSISRARAQAELTEVAEALLMAVARRAPHVEEREHLLTHLRDVVLPEVDAETEGVRQAPEIHGPRYARAVTNEHRMLHVLVEELEATDDAIEAAALAGAIVVLCENRFQQEGFLDSHHGEDADQPRLVGLPS